MSVTENYPRAWRKTTPASHSSAGQEGQNRKRSNSQSQVVAPLLSIYPQSAGLSGSSNRSRSAGKEGKNYPQKRHQAEYYVTLTPLNDTFVKKHIHVPYYPETCKLGRPTGTKVKPYVTNGYFDSRVLSRNHACMFIEPKTGQLMIQDMGSSNGTFVNLEKIATEPVPINIGDVVNLGFNIQVETSHKQISAKIENINVASNNPKGSVLSGLPQLTQDVINNFSASEMKHFDFIQSVFSLLLEKKEIEQEGTPEEESPGLKTLKAFERAMFTDMMPSIEDSLASTTGLNNNAGIFSNSRIVNSNDLESTIEVLTVNLAKVKQQNTTLKTLETFMSNYLNRLNDINSTYLKTEVDKYDAALESNLRTERDKWQKMIDEHERKSAEQRKIMATLEDELDRVKADKVDLTRKLEDQQRLTRTVSSDSELDFDSQSFNDRTDRKVIPQTPEKQANGADISALDFCSTTGKSLKDVSPDASEEVEEISNSSDVESEDSPRAKEAGDVGTTLHGENATAVKNHFIIHMLLQLSQYKNQGVVLGFFVVVAGFLYQSSSK